MKSAKAVALVVDGVTYYNQIPLIPTPFASENVAGTIMPLDRLRWISTATSNLRDFGGWNCDGGTIKYGKLFRGGEPQAQDADMLVRECGVKAELNLRGDELGEYRD